MDAKTIGRIIREFRKKKKLSQEVVSGLAGIGRTHLAAIEHGDRRPTLDTFCRIALALNMRPSDLLAQIENEMDEI